MNERRFILSHTTQKELYTPGAHAQQTVIVHTYSNLLCKLYSDYWFVIHFDNNIYKVSILQTRHGLKGSYRWCNCYCTVWMAGRVVRLRTQCKLIVSKDVAESINNWSSLATYKAVCSWRAYICPAINCCFILLSLCSCINSPIFIICSDSTDSCDS